MAYEPAPEILDRYAAVAVNYALGSGEGIKSGDTVLLRGTTSSLPFVRAAQRRIIESGGHIIRDLHDDMGGLDRHFYTQASDEQVDHRMPHYEQGIVEEADHRLHIHTIYDMDEWSSWDPSKVMRRQQARDTLIRGLTEKERAGKHTWTALLYGSEAMAASVGMTQEEYWEQIIKACYLDHEDPVSEWRRLKQEIGGIAAKLTELEIKYVQVLAGDDTDLRVKIGDRRHWLSSTGRNVPSFEIFTSPDHRETEGRVRFNQPWTRFGSPVEGIQLSFANGQLVDFAADTNEDKLKQFIEREPAARRLGEFSLTDRRHSRIDRPIGEALYDENMGGEFGNFHIALGDSYPQAYDGDVASVSPEELAELGFNKAATPNLHEDFVSTADRTVVATLRDGTETVIYERGQFQLAA